MPINQAEIDADIIVGRERRADFDRVPGPEPVGGLWHCPTCGAPTRTDYDGKATRYLDCHACGWAFQIRLWFPRKEVPQTSDQ